MWYIFYQGFSIILSGRPTDIQGWTCAIFILAWGSSWGSLGFSCNQNNCGLSGTYVTCIYCSLNVKIKTCEMPHGARRSWMHLYCSLPVWSAKTWKPPILSPMADAVITLGCIWGLGSPLYICGQAKKGQGQFKDICLRAKKVPLPYVFLCVLKLTRVKQELLLNGIWPTDCLLRTPALCIWYKQAVPGWVLCIFLTTLTFRNR